MQGLLLPFARGVVRPRNDYLSTPPNVAGGREEVGDVFEVLFAFPERICVEEEHPHHVVLLLTRCAADRLGDTREGRSRAQEFLGSLRVIVGDHYGTLGPTLVASSAPGLLVERFN